MNSLIVKSPSKINLYLKVIGRRKDGYHKLVTIFQRISLADIISIKKQKTGFRLTCLVSSGLKQNLSCGEDNLITKAYRLLQSKFPNLGGVSVRLIKKTPMGAGIGGGSGNAAAFLIGMKKLYALSISKKTLTKLGSRLGADVAFFLYDKPLAVGRGVGDEIKSLRIKGKLWFVLVLSEKGLSTPQVYKNLPRMLPPVSLTKINTAVRLIGGLLSPEKCAGTSGLLENDLELPAFSLRPELQKMIKKIYEKGYEATRMTGSGPTVFSMVSSFKAAQKLAGELRREFPKNKVIVCSSF